MHTCTSLRMNTFIPKPSSLKMTSSRCMNSDHAISMVYTGNVFQQTVGILIVTNCSPLLTDIFLYSYEEEAVCAFGVKQTAYRFNFMYSYIDDTMSINNSDFENYLGKMYPVELEIKDTIESKTFASCLDCRSKETVHFTVPFTTNATISILL